MHIGFADVHDRLLMFLFNCTYLRCWIMEYNAGALQTRVNRLGEELKKRCESVTKKCITVKHRGSVYFSPINKKDWKRLLGGPAHGFFFREDNSFHSDVMDIQELVCDSSHVNVIGFSL